MITVHQRSVMRIAIAFLLLLPGCRSAVTLGTGITPQLTSGAADATAIYLMGSYAGVLPCADCGGIRTTLKMYAKSPIETGAGTFALSEEYVGTRGGNSALDARGQWTILRGTPADVDATVYQLNVDAEQRVLYFLRVGDSALRLLDREQREIRSPASHTLTRVADIVPGGYTAIDPADPEVRAAAEFAVSEHSSRTGTTVALRRVSRAERQVVAGLNYWLCLTVTVASQDIDVLVVVYRDVQQRLSLTQWSSGSCANE
jgi:uncharacterized lipoprotein NlpE involved in copper resistance